ncbi:hypothetical protein B0H13DRAFT_2406074 [Mycena leptocephala]|nr:hypothetical protein B0H13DRAFT_2406074 [Mycena leptocephala]
MPARPFVDDEGTVLDSGFVLHRTLEGLEANDLAKVGEDEDDIEGEEVQDDEDGRNRERGETVYRTRHAHTPGRNHVNLREEAEVGIEAKYEGGISLQMVVKTKERTESHLSATECYSVTRREFPRAAFVDASSINISRLDQVSPFGLRSQSFDLRQGGLSKRNKLLTSAAGRGLLCYDLLEIPHQVPPMQLEEYDGLREVLVSNYRNIFAARALYVLHWNRIPERTLGIPHRKCELEGVDRHAEFYQEEKNAIFNINHGDEATYHRRIDLFWTEVLPHGLLGRHQLGPTVVVSPVVAILTSNPPLLTTPKHFVALYGFNEQGQWSRA